MKIRDHRFLDQASLYNKDLFKLILLNQPLDKSSFIRLYGKASMIVCADGGSNWLFDAFNFDHERLKYKPHAIVGDLDSIRPEVRVFYETAGTRLVRYRNQDNTDFEKSILYVLEEQKKKQASQS